jgi:hypothetical protein
MPYKPSENLPMLKVSSDPVFVSEYTGRWAFLEALQLEGKKFWADLRDLQQQGDPGEIVKWMTRAGVTDEWFVGVIWETIGFWHAHPESPRSRLEPGERWFRYPLVEDASCQIPIFDPRFSKAAFCDSADREEVIVRLCSEFESQLRQYFGYLDSITGEDHPELRQHAQWTALAFTGLSYTRIAYQFKYLGTSDQPDAIVKMAVRRFSTGIGLTLPRRRRT